MRIGYLLESTDLWGGVKVVLQHVRILRDIGLDAHTYSPEPAPDWWDVRGAHRQVASLDEILPRSLDIAIGTFWTTVESAVRAGRVAVQFCQGYEGDHPGLQGARERIEALYRLPTVKWAVSPSVAALLRERFDQRSELVPPPVDHDLFHPPEVEPPSSPFRVLVPGLLEPPERGVPWVWEALGPLMREEPPVRIVRLCQWRAREEAAPERDAEYHVRVPPALVPPVYRSVHAVVAPSAADGFGLPLLEGMATGRPCVASDIPAYRDQDPAGRATVRVPWGDVSELRAAVRRLRDDPAARARMGAAGQAIARAAGPARTRRALQRAIRIAGASVRAS